MIRYGQSFGYMDKTSSTRPDKSSVKLKKLETKQKRSKTMVAVIKKDLIQRGIDPDTNEYIQRETGLQKLAKKAHSFRGGLNWIIGLFSYLYLSLLIVYLCYKNT